MLLIIDNFDSFTYNLVQYLGELGAEPRVFRNDAITLDEIERAGFDGIVISPGPGTPSCAGISIPAIQRFAGKIPILGVCLGHQAIGEAFGGRIVRAPKPIHGKPCRVSHDGRGLFAGLPQGVEVARYHSLVIERGSLPSCLEISAETPCEGHENIIMAVRHRTLAVEGVQFHPESILTSTGKTMLTNFLAVCAKKAPASATA